MKEGHITHILNKKQFTSQTNNDKVKYIQVKSFDYQHKKS
jgi:hypothetical protein